MYGAGIREHPAREGLHGDKAHVFLAAERDKPEFLVARQVAEGILHRLEAVRFDELEGECQFVRRDADMPDEALFPGLQRSLKGAAVDLLPVRHHMELEQIDVICLHPLEREADMAADSLVIPALALCGDHELLPDVGQRQADLFLRVRVRVRGIEVAEAALIRTPQDGNAFIYAAALDRQRPEGGFCDSQSGFSEYHGLHRRTPLRLSYSG